MSKYRHELKFIISKRLANILKYKLSLLMNLDENSTNDNNTYFIRSIYFDDPKSTAYYEKIDGIEYRKKYRIRYYNFDKNFIKLECKYKNKDLTKKESILIDRELCEKLISENLDDLFINDIKEEGLLKNFITEVKIKNIKPIVIVDYERQAYTLDLSDLRITFDEDVRSSAYNKEFFNKNLPAHKMIEDDKEVLEVKFNEFIPEHIANILSTIPMFRQSVSKFALCRSIL